MYTMNSDVPLTTSKADILGGEGKFLTHMHSSRRSFHSISLLEEILIDFIRSLILQEIFNFVIESKVMIHTGANKGGRPAAAGISEQHSTAGSVLKQTAG